MSSRATLLRCVACRVLIVKSPDSQQSRSLAPPAHCEDVAGVSADNHCLLQENRRGKKWHSCDNRSSTMTSLALAILLPLVSTVQYLPHNTSCTPLKTHYRGSLLATIETHLDTRITMFESHCCVSYAVLLCCVLLF